MSVTADSRDDGQLEGHYDMQVSTCSNTQSSQEDKHMHQRRIVECCSAWLYWLYPARAGTTG